MTKEHVIQLTITNNTGNNLSFTHAWFDSGRVADGNSWPDTIASGSSAHIKCYERDWSTAGCSGWVSYTMAHVQGSIPAICFAFSNPVVGMNKIGVGLDDKIWDNMESYYTANPVIIAALSVKRQLWAQIQSTPGDTNNATYDLQIRDLNSVDPSNPDIRWRSRN